MTDDHLAFAYSLANVTAPEWLRVCRGGIPLPTTFGQRIRARVELQFVIVDRRLRVPLGVAALWDHDRRSRWCLGEVQVVPVAHQPRREGPAVESWATKQLLQVAFDRVGVERVYFERMAWNPPVADAGWRGRREALVPALVYHDGSHWDVSVTRFAAEDVLP